MGSSFKKFEDELKEPGSRLLPQNCVNELMNQLHKLEQILSMAPQEPCISIRDVPATTALVSDELLSHPDMNVKVSVLSCITELLRIFAPEPPYDDEKMKEIFQLTLVAFRKLSDMAGHCYAKAVRILNIIARVNSSLLMQDLECDELIVEMFQLFLDIIRHDHPSGVFLDMESIMALIIEESDEISFQLLYSVKKGNWKISPISRVLGEKVLKNCSAILKTRLPQIVESVGLDLNDYAKIVHSICHGEPQKEYAVAEELVPETMQTEINKGIPKKRDRKPNSRLKPEEGYDHFWFANRRRSVAKKKAGEFIDKCVTEESGNKELVSLSLNREEFLLNKPSKRKGKRKWTPPKKQHGEELVGCKIKVWWPLDQVFYEGSITSFDPVEKKHKVLFFDNEQEILDLRLERWELLGKLSLNQEEDENLGTQAALSDMPRKKAAKTRPESSIEQERNYEASL